MHFWINDQREESWVYPCPKLGNLQSYPDPHMLTCFINICARSYSPCPHCLISVSKAHPALFFLKTFKNSKLSPDPQGARMNCSSHFNKDMSLFSPGWSLFLCKQWMICNKQAPHSAWEQSCGSHRICSIAVTSQRKTEGETIPNT